MKKKILIFILSCIAVLILAACNDTPAVTSTEPPETDPPPKEYTVRFVSLGTVLEQSTVREGERAYPPEDPKRYGYVFNGWYVGEELWDESAAVTSDLEIVAGWIEEEPDPIFMYDAKFLVDGEEYKTVGVYEGMIPEMPEDPKMDKRDFDGWYYEGERIDSIPLDAYGDIKIEAQWVYYIDTAEELLKMIPKGKYVLECDIDLGGALWTPVGDSGDPFIGYLYGNGHTISNFRMEISGGYTCVGLIGYNKGTVKELNIKDFTLTSSSSMLSHVGGIVGYNDGGTVSGCSVTENMSVTIKDVVYMGGIVGYNYDGRISDCTYSGNLSVFAKSSRANAYAGGIVGGNRDYSTVVNCTAVGEIDASGDYGAYAGGISGTNSGSLINCEARNSSVSALGLEIAYAGGVSGANGPIYATIVNCFALGNVSAETSDYGSSRDAYAGGIVGGNSGSIVNCYSVGDVNGKAHDFAYVGGGIGINNGGNIKNCFAVGNVDAKADPRYMGKATVCVGGFVGKNSGAIDNCYVKKNQTVSTSGGTVHTDDLGMIVDAANFTSNAWIKDNLFKYEKGIWDVTKGYPVLDYDYIRNTVLDVSNETELRELQGKYLVLDYRLTADIRLGSRSFEPIAFVSGTFDGNGKTIFGCVIDDSAHYTGLIGINAGAVRELGIEDVRIEVTFTKDYFRVGTIVGLNCGVLENSYADGKVSATGTNVFVGGLVGFMGSGSVDNCYSDVTVIGKGESVWVGGVAGFLERGSLHNCYALGDVNGEATVDSACGGGVTVISNKKTVYNCYFAAEQNVALKGINVIKDNCGTKLEKAKILTSAFHIEKLGWSEEIWSFNENEVPKLK